METVVQLVKSYPPDGISGSHGGEFEDDKSSEILRRVVP
jgi:hypothetical protein